MADRDRSCEICAVGLHIGTPRFIRDMTSSRAIALSCEDLGNLTRLDFCLNCDYVVVEICEDLQFDGKIKSLCAALSLMRQANSNLVVYLWETQLVPSIMDFRELFPYSNKLITYRDHDFQDTTFGGLEVLTRPFIRDESVSCWFFDGNSSVSLEESIIPSVLLRGQQSSSQELLLECIQYASLGSLVKAPYSAALFNSVPSLQFESEIFDELMTIKSEDRRDGVLRFCLFLLALELRSRFSKIQILKQILREADGKFLQDVRIEFRNFLGSDCREGDYEQGVVSFCIERKNAEHPVYEVKNSFPGQVDAAFIDLLLPLVNISAGCSLTVDISSRLAGRLGRDRYGEVITGDSGVDAFAKPPSISVVVPVHNNGSFLLGKCIPSLLTNDRWAEFEVLLIDDGSLDNKTILFCELLSKISSNVRCVFLDRPSSGSASRPRNTGIRLASAQYVGFLDPDNASSAQMYDRLLDGITSSARSVDFISGSQMRVAGNTRALDASYRGPLALLGRISGKAFLWIAKFPVVSTQAALISRSLLLNSKINFIEGAVGQDSLFGWQVVTSSERILFFPNVRIFYYSEREGSVTNAIEPNYFEKSLIREQATVCWLAQQGLLRRYRRTKFVRFLRDWYFPRLGKVDPQGLPQASKALSAIVELYVG